MKKLLIIPLFFLFSLYIYCQDTSKTNNNIIVLKSLLNVTDFAYESPERLFLYNIETEKKILSHQSISLKLGYFPYHKQSYFFQDFLDFNERLGLKGGSAFEAGVFFRYYFSKVINRKSHLKGIYWSLGVSSTFLQTKKEADKILYVFYNPTIMLGWQLSYKNFFFDLIPLNFIIRYNKFGMVYQYNFSISVGYKILK